LPDPYLIRPFVDGNAMRYVLCLVVLLASCSSMTPEERAARRQAAYEAEQQQLAAQREAYRQRLYSQCSAYGFQQGTPDFSRCLMQVDTANQQQDAQMRAVILQQLLQQQYQSMPLCSSLPPGMAGYRRAEATCR
jgi:hypothetical protein